MIRSAAGKVMWVGRATVFLVGLAVILALLFGVASTAFAHGGDKGFFHLGHKNVSQAVSKLIKRGAGPALDLRVGSGPPLKVNSSERVAKLNADKLDGKDATEIGVNGLERVKASSVYNAQGIKSATVQCPPGKKVLGGGASYSSFQTAIGRSSGDEIAIQDSAPVFDTGWTAGADWTGGSGNAPFNWRVIAYAVCAKAP